MRDKLRTSMPGLLNADYQITDLGSGSDKQGFVLVLLVSLAAKLNKSSRWWACRSLSARGHSKEDVHSEKMSIQEIGDAP